MLAAVAAARGGAVVVVLQLQFIDKVVDVLMQLEFQQSRVCTGSSSTECWPFQLRTERYPQCTLCRRLFLASMPCDQQRQFPQSRGSNPHAPVCPLSGERSCCETDFVEFHMCSSWTRWRYARCCDDRCSSRCGLGGC